MKKLILATILMFGGISSTQADYVNWQGYYVYECTAFSTAGSNFNGHGWSVLSRSHSCRLAMTACRMNTPVGYWCSH